MKLAVFFFLLIGLFGCKEATKSANPLSVYFHPFDDDPKVYVFRDKASGLDERFMRIFRIDDSYGKHMVTELYAADGRLIEAFNYNIDSLYLMDHMVVDGNRVNQKGELGKYKYFPMSKNGKGEFLSKFPGPDSTFILLEKSRRVLVNSPKMQKVIDEKEETIIFSDDFTATMYGPNGEAIDQKKGTILNYYAKGYGLVRWHDKNKTQDYKLEKIISETEFANRIKER